ncbi:MAG: hypothetical protein GY719_31590 [bacterium]|nr:hypothetical protein [bacterium]
MKATTSIEIETLTPRQVAEFFCSLDSDEQAEVFDQIADISERWRAEAKARNPNGCFLGADWQWWQIRQKLTKRAHVVLLDMSQLLFEKRDY